MLMCVYCETFSDFPQGYCEDCQRYDGIVTVDSDDYFDEEVIDYYAEASLFGDC